MRSKREAEVTTHDGSCSNGPTESEYFKFRNYRFNQFVYPNSNEYAALYSVATFSLIESANALREFSRESLQMSHFKWKMVINDNGDYVGDSERLNKTPIACT